MILVVSVLPEPLSPLITTLCDAPRSRSELYTTPATSYTCGGGGGGDASSRGPSSAPAEMAVLVWYVASWSSLYSSGSRMNGFIATSTGPARV